MNSCLGELASGRSLSFHFSSNLHVLRLSNDAPAELRCHLIDAHVSTQWKSGPAATTGTVESSLVIRRCVALALLTSVTGAVASAHPLA